MNFVQTLARWLLGRRLPVVSGRVTLEGLRQPVSIARDGFGVPYIDAATDEDAWFALGYCHAQDRAGQLEIIIRLLRGTLAEVLGPDGVPLDRLTRRLQVYRAGVAQFEVAQPAIRRQLEAYAAGINGCYDTSRRRPSHEHALLGREPTRWRGQDCQVFAAYLCFMLAANWDIELLRLRILACDGPEAVAALEPHYPEWLANVVPQGGVTPPRLDRLAEDLSAVAPLFGVGGGSNAWAVSPERSATGRPILANDPHLMPSAPSQWYLARIATPTWRAAGGTFVGTAAVAAGHNEHIAWGVTAGHADHTDLFL
ncbi:MAG: penicillin acylase family protein, partial [Myxococcota bacterium]|nr:penicillin acylase family protein [Myxococcota bacterium]